MYIELNSYSLINSLLQQECDKLANAAMVGDADVIFTLINDGVDINAPVNEVHICSQLLHVYIYIYIHIYIIRYVIIRYVST